MLSKKKKQTFDYETTISVPAEDSVLAVKVRRFLVCDEELTAVRVRTAVRHRQNAPPVVLSELLLAQPSYTHARTYFLSLSPSTYRNIVDKYLEGIMELVRELATPDGSAALASAGGITALNHEPLYVPVELGVVVVPARAERQKILCQLTIK
jgi:hypothetical protein